MIVQRLETAVRGVRAGSPASFGIRKTRQLYSILLRGGEQSRRRLHALNDRHLLTQSSKYTKMADGSHIEWTEATWNPVTGCHEVSAGCKNCYAERLAKRLHLMGNGRYRNAFRLTLHEDVVDLPARGRRAVRCSVNSMSDLFHEDVAAAFHPARVPYDAGMSAARVSSAHEAKRALATNRRSDRMAK